MSVSGRQWTAAVDAGPAYTQKVRQMRTTRTDADPGAFGTGGHAGYGRCLAVG